MLANRVIMVVLSISTVILVQWNKFREEQVATADRVVWSIHANIIHLSV